MRQQSLVEVGKYVKRVLVLGQRRVQRPGIAAITAVQDRRVVGTGAACRQDQGNYQDKCRLCGRIQTRALSRQPAAASIVALLIAAT